jgi:hypothetical protein
MLDFDDDQGAVRYAETLKDGFDLEVAAAWPSSRPTRTTSVLVGIAQCPER